MRVKIIRSTMEDDKNEFVGMFGQLISFKEVNRIDEEQMYVVELDNGKRHCFWGEELEHTTQEKQSDG
jgi:hypothetical protein